MATLIYIADPMCSWCYGFGPELALLLEGLPDTPLEIVLGGLRAHNTQVMHQAQKEELRGHWRQVQEASGLPFSESGIAGAGFTYDTEPACRAVVSARSLAPKATFKVFQAIQRAFYAEGLDVTQGEVLARLASEELTGAGFPIDAGSFLAYWSSAAMVDATKADFAQTKNWGVSGFPTLVLEHAGKLNLVASGYRKAEALVQQMQTIVDQAAGSAPAG